MTREEATAFLQGRIYLIDKYYPQIEDYREALDLAIKALEQEPRKGHWIMTNDYLTTAYGSVDYVKCSCCGENSLEEGNYCHNCGAKMVEPQKSEKIDCKATKCENCQNHNYCDFEPQESEDRE